LAVFSKETIQRIFQKKKKLAVINLLLSSCYLFKGVP
jgi:hypothetical protein